MNKNLYRTILAIVTVAAIIIGCVIHIGGCMRGDTGDREGKTTGKIRDDISLDEFVRLNMDVGVVDLDVKQGDSYSISYDTDKEKAVPVISQEGDVVTVTQKGFKASDAIGTKNINMDMTITIPRDAAMSDWDLDIGVGDVDISDVSAKNISVDVGVGDLDIEGCTADVIDVDAGVGDVDIARGSFTELSIDAGMGDVEVSEVKDLDSYTLDVSVGTGGLTIAGQRQEGLGKDYKHEGTGSGSIRIDAGLGEVSIN